MSSWCQATARRVLIGLTPGRRGLLSHRLVSSQAPDFGSRPAEVQQALSTVSQALTPLKAHKTVTWRLSSGSDDIAVWRTIWEQQEHLVCRVYHTDRKVAFQEQQGHWHEGDIAQARGDLRSLARVEPTLELKRGKQVRRKRAIGAGGTGGLPAARDLREQCASPGARQADHARRMARGGTRARSGLGAVAAAHRLAGHRCAVCGAPLYHVPRALERGGQFQISQNLPGLLRGA